MLDASPVQLNASYFTKEATGRSSVADRDILEKRQTRRATAPVDVLVLDGETGFALKVIRSLALNPRWRIHVMGLIMDGRRPPIAYSAHAQSFHGLLPNLQESAVVARILEVVRETRAAIVMPVVESTNLTLIRHRDRFVGVARLTALPEEADFVTAIDKYTLAQFMAAKGIPHPPTWAPDADGKDMIFPLLVKPRRASGGQGIVKVTCLAELNAVRRTLVPGSFCLQSYIEGDDFSCSVLAENGPLLAWTVQSGEHRQAPFAPLLQVRMQAHEPVLAVVKKLMASLRWSGVANMDLRVDRHTGQPLVLEVNGRYWATLLASTSVAVNFPDLACKATIGESWANGETINRRFSALKPWLSDLLRLRPRAFRRQVTDLSYVLGDPKPEIAKLWSRWCNLGIRNGQGASQVPVSLN